MRPAKMKLQPCIIQGFREATKVWFTSLFPSYRICIEKQKSGCIRGTQGEWCSTYSLRGSYWEAFTHHPQCSQRMWIRHSESATTLNMQVKIMPFKSTVIRREKNVMVCAHCSVCVQALCENWRWCCSCEAKKGFMNTFDWLIGLIEACIFGLYVVQYV